MTNYHKAESALSLYVSALVAAMPWPPYARKPTITPLGVKRGVSVEIPIGATRHSRWISTRQQAAPKLESLWSEVTSNAVALDVGRLLRRDIDQSVVASSADMKAFREAGESAASRSRAMRGDLQVALDAEMQGDVKTAAMLRNKVLGRRRRPK